MLLWGIVQGLGLEESQSDFRQHDKVIFRGWHLVAALAETGMTRMKVNGCESSAGNMGLRDLQRNPHEPLRRGQLWL